MFCAPTATLECLAASITDGSRTGEGNRAISSRVWPETRGRNASTKAFASEGVLYIFQLAAMSFLRDIVWSPQGDFIGPKLPDRVMENTGREQGQGTRN